MFVLVFNICVSEKSVLKPYGSQYLHSIILHWAVLSIKVIGLNFFCVHLKGKAV